MRVSQLKLGALAVTAAIGLGGCAYGPYGGLGVGVGYGDGYYDPYYGSGYYGDGYYGSSYYGGIGYGTPGYGWYDGYYYPGSGYYVYDRHRNPYRWSDTQRRYWQWRQRGAPRATGGTGQIVQNWADFQNGPRATNNNVRQQRGVRTNQTFTEPTRERVQQPRRVVRSEGEQQDRRGNRGGRNRHTQQD